MREVSLRLTSGLVEGGQVSKPNGIDADNQFATVIDYHFEPIGLDEDKSRSGTWRMGSITIPKGQSFVDLVITFPSDANEQWDQKYRLVVDDWTNRSESGQTEHDWPPPVTIRVLDGGSHNDYGSHNVDTGVTGLSRERVLSLGGQQISLYDGSRVWYVSFDEGILPGIYSSPSSSVVNTVELPDDKSPSGNFDALVAIDRPIAVSSSDRAVIALGSDLTLRRSYGGLSDLGDFAAVLNPNPTISDGRFGFVDRLVPVETHHELETADDDITPLLGFELLRRDGSSAWYSAKPTGTAAKMIDRSWDGVLPQWRFESLETNRFYQITVPTGYYNDLQVGLRLVMGTWVTDGAASGTSPNGTTIGFVIPDENGYIEFVYDGDYRFAPSSMSAYDRWTFVTPDGSRSPDDEALAVLTSAADEAGDVRLVLETKYGDRYEFDGRGLLTAESDRFGNRTEYAYESSRLDAYYLPGDPDDPSVSGKLADDPLRQRLREVKYQGGLTLTLTYASAEGNELASIKDSLGRATIVSGITLISTTPTADAPTEEASLPIHATSGNPINKNAVPVTGLDGGDGATYLMQVGEHPNYTYKLAPTGMIGRLLDDGLPAGIEEATATYQRPFYVDATIEAPPGEWTYQFDRFGLTTAKAAPKGADDSARQVWQWDRDERSGLVLAYRVPDEIDDGNENTPPVFGFRETLYHYDSQGNLDRIDYVDGTYEAWAYDPTKKNQAVSYTDRHGNIWDYALNLDGNVHTTHDPLANTVIYTYQSGTTTVAGRPNGLIQSVLDETGRMTAYSYYVTGAKNGLLKTKTYFRAGETSLVESYDYDAFGHLQKKTDVDGVQHTYQYDKLGQLLEERIGGTVAPDGKLSGGILVARYTYDSAGNLRTKSLPQPNFDDAHDDRVATTLYEYDKFNRVVKMTEPGIVGMYDAPVTEYEYYGDGLLRRVTDPFDRVTTYEYDDRRQLTKVTESGASQGVVKRAGGTAFIDDTVTEYHYDAAGNLQSVVDPLDRQTDYFYDRIGRRITSRAPDPDGDSAPLNRFVTRTEYDDDMRVTVEYSPNPSESGEVSSRTFYDAAGRLVREQGPFVLQPDNTTVLAQFTSYEYDDAGFVLYVRRGLTSANPNTVRNPPTSNAPLATQLSGDVVQSAFKSFYDVVGRVIRTETTFREGDSWRTVAESITRSFVNGLLVEEAIDAKQNVTTTYYNQFGQVSAIVYPVPQSKDADGVWLPAPVTLFQYFNNGALKKQIETTALGGESDPHARVTSFTYDGAGRVLSTTVAGLTTKYRYDELGRVTKEIADDGSYVEHLYNTNGQEYQTETYDTDGTLLAKVERKFDEVGMLVYMKDAYGDETYYDYDKLDRMIAQREPDTSFADDSNPNRTEDKTTTYVYNAAGQVKDVVGPGGQHTAYEDLDALGRALHSFEDASGTSTTDTWTTYDDVARTTRIKAEDENVTTLERDGLGRVVREGINIASPGRPTSVEFRTSRYDDNGNLSSYTDRDGRVTTYAYDALDRRISEVSKDPAGNFTNKNEFAYDAYGNLNAARAFGYGNGQWIKIVDYRYENYDAKGRAGKITESLYDGAAWQTVVFEYDYDDALDAGAVPTARSGYTVTASRSGAVFYTNTYQFDALGREVFASQDAPGDLNDKQVVQGHYLSGGPQVADSNDPTPYAARRDLLIRKQKATDGDFNVVAQTAAFYEDGDSQLVRRIEHRGVTDDVLISPSSSKPIIHLYNYDALDRARRYVDRTHDGNVQNIYDPSNPTNSTNSSAPYSRLTESPSGNTEDIAYDLEGHVTAFEDTINANEDYTLTWNAGDRLVKVTRNAGLGDNVTRFGYDPFGRLIAKQSENGTLLLYFYDGGQATLTFNAAASGTPVSRSFYSAAGDLLAVDAIGSATTTYWALDDNEQTTRDWIYRDPATGYSTLIAVDFDDFGEPTSEPGFVGAVRFQGRTYVAELQGYYNGRRWTSALVDGRSLSMNTSTTVNRYGGSDGGASPQDGWFNSMLVSGWSAWDNSSGTDIAHGLLGAAGFIPVIGFLADVANAGLYAYNGQKADAMIALISAIPGAGDALGAAMKGTRAAAKIGALANRSAAIGTGVGQVGRAVGVSVASNAFEQGARIYYGKQETFHWEEAVGAAVSAGSLGYASVGVGRLMEASRSAVARAAVLTAGSGAAAAFGDAAMQASAIYSGRQDSFNLSQSALAFGGGALAGAAGQLAGLYDKTCFRAGTPMLWEHGHKAVEHFKVGDRLYARNEFEPNGPLELKAIEEVFIRQGLVLEVTVGGQIIGTTAEHPFYVYGKGWTPAGVLIVGDLLATADGRWLPVDKLYNTGNLETVYNFRVAEHHTYFVGGDEWEFAVWAHNAKCNPQVHQIASDKGFSGIRVTSNGGPDFSDTSYLYKTKPGQSNTVRITLTGGRRGDYRAANALAGFSGSKAPQGYRWHHVDDFDPSSGTATMQLVKRAAHQATLPHRGSVAQYEDFYGVTYRR